MWDYPPTSYRAKFSGDSKIFGFGYLNIIRLVVNLLMHNREAISPIVTYNQRAAQLRLSISKRKSDSSIDYPVLENFMLIFE